ncbi:DUF4810 domain-containing protein [Sulfurimonas marina]|uniref:DUF4810 domain-containing protein n=1 Tax=Sulfurimonas marina TaxID=2590551 RepID=A0A7M3V945_9BACT|nr:DUF4810 domain-containing protein [Sulfurimonas marina]QOP40278.1 DUF4810 domain-containing protein [Sulfurimonas marina]
MKRLKLLTLSTFALITLAMSGCSTHTPLYNYGEYSENYYSLKKEATQETALEYQKSLEYCIENAKESRSGRVPPGIYANLGYLYLKAGQNKKAIENFTKEKTIYPEATFFMDKMINKVEALEQEDDK